MRQALPLWPSRPKTKCIFRRDKTSLSGRLRRLLLGVFKHRASTGLRRLLQHSPAGWWGQWNTASRAIPSRCARGQRQAPHQAADQHRPAPAAQAPMRHQVRPAGRIGWGWGQSPRGRDCQRMRAAVTTRHSTRQQISTGQPQQCKPGCATRCGAPVALAGDGAGYRVAVNASPGAQRSPPGTPPGTAPGSRSAPASPSSASPDAPSGAARRSHWPGLGPVTAWP